MLARVPFVLLLVACLYLVGCGRPVTYSEQPKPAHVITQVKKGMTEQQVIAILGEPTRRGQMLVYPKDPVKTADKEQILYWENTKFGNMQVQFKVGKVHGIFKK